MTECGALQRPVVVVKLRGQIVNFLLFGKDLTPAHQDLMLDRILVLLVACLILQVCFARCHILSLVINVLA